MEARIEAAGKLLAKHGWTKVNDGWERQNGGYGFEAIMCLGGTIYAYVGFQSPGSGISNIEVIGAMFCRAKEG